MESSRFPEIWVPQTIGFPIDLIAMTSERSIWGGFVWQWEKHGGGPAPAGSFSEVCFTSWGELQAIMIYIYTYRIQSTNQKKTATW